MFFIFKSDILDFIEYSIRFFDFGFKKIDSIPISFSLWKKTRKYLDTIIYLKLDFYILEPDLSGDFKNEKSIQSVPFLFSELWKDFYYRNILLLILFFGILVVIIFLFRNHIFNNEKTKCIIACLEELKGGKKKEFVYLL